MKFDKSIPLLTFLALLSAGHQVSAQQYGADPKLPEPYRGLLPTMKIASPATRA